MSFPGNAAAPNARVVGHVVTVGTTPTEILPFPGEGNEYFIDHLYVTAAGVGGTARRVALLLDRANQNLALQSETFDNAAWTKTQTTVTANNTNSPFGANTADRLAENTANAEHSISQGSLAVTSGVFYTFDVYARPNGRNIALELGAGFAANTRAIFRIKTLADQPMFNPVVATGGATASYENVGGFFRCRLIAQATSSTNTTAKILLVNDADALSYTGDNASGAWLFGASLRERSASNVYRVTVGSAVLVQPAEVHPVFVQGTDISGGAFHFPTPLRCESGAPVRVVCTASITDCAVGVSGYKAARGSLAKVRGAL